MVHAELQAAGVIHSVHVQTGMHRVKGVGDEVAQESRPQAFH